MTPTAAAIAAPPATRPRLPGQIAYIIGNEGCERFSFYGMRNILTEFLATSALLVTATSVISATALKADRDAAAKEVFHTIDLGVYFVLLLGGWLSVRILS